MTQGTKVGLLVSLAFLIAILVLLSDHVATSNDPRPAQVTSAGLQVAQGIVTPGAQGAEPVELVTGASHMAPAQAVPIVQEMITRQAPPLIDIGPARTGELEIAANNNVPLNMRVSPVQLGGGASILSLGEAGREALPPLPLPNGFVPVTPGVSNTQLAHPGQTAAVAPVAGVIAPVAGVVAPKSFEHKAQPGDTVSKMARKYYGLDTKTNRSLILSANKSLKADPNKIEVGKVYVIPVKPGSVSAAQAVAATAVVAAPVAPSVVAPVVVAAPAPPERAYVVKPHDNLWKIARDQCNDVNLVDQIKKMNAGSLKNGIDLKVGSKLRLPAKKS